MKIVSAVLVLALFVASATAHAVSRDPIPWNVNPSTTAVCGGGTNTNTATQTYTVGQQMTIKWSVVASDGNGPVTAVLDTTGNTNFATGVSIPLTGTQPSAGVGDYTFTATTPDVTCTGAGATCTLQLKSSSNWYSCATVKIVRSTGGSTTVAPTIPRTCVVGKGLTFCTWMNGQNVALPLGQISAIAVDYTLQVTYNQYLANPQIFSTPDNPNCYGWFKKLLCGSTFQPCNERYGTGGCNQACVNTNNYCGITQLHSTLYQCSANYTNTDSDMTGNCSGAGSIKVSAVVMIASALLSIVAYML